MNHKYITATLLLTLSSTAVVAETCKKLKDNYAKYDALISSQEINRIASQYYVLSYTWSPDYCDTLSNTDKKPGQKAALQCAKNNKFGYILHGLWPEGALNGEGGYPRACGGDQEKISKKILQNFLCMTPSFALLQHEYEYHGTCMHDASLQTPTAYFNKALELHSTLRLPIQKLDYSEAAIQWLVNNNPQLSRDSIQYHQDSQEWQFCYDNNFNVMACPHNTTSNILYSGASLTGACPVKGNISYNSGRKYYFTAVHGDYNSVVITPERGERCFATEQDAINAGWEKAPLSSYN